MTPEGEARHVGRLIDAEERFLRRDEPVGPSEAVTTSVAQMRALAMLEERYGGSRFAPSADLAPGTLRVEGLHGPDSVAARWLVPRDGRVSQAWDPDGLLARYLDEMEAKRRRGAL